MPILLLIFDRTILKVPKLIYLRMFMDQNIGRYQVLCDGEVSLNFFFIVMLIWILQ